jgi:peptidoglycan/xylan/chitin deacetylase (PgdA/CDA1 family)
VAAYVADPARLALDRRSARARFEAEFTESRFGDRLAAIIAVPPKGSGRGEPALASAASPRIEGLQALKSLTFSISRSLHARVLARPLPDRIAVYFHGLEAADRQALAQCVAALRGLGYRSVGLDAYLDPATPGRVFNVSFDDNYRSWHEALADLDRLDLITTFYANSLPFRDVADASTIAAYFDRLALGVGREPLSRTELAEIARAGHGIGCHSHSHFVMSSLSHSAWDAEIRVSKSILEDIIGSEVRHFSWPYGMPRHFSEPLKDYCLAAGFHSIAAAAPCMLHAGIGDRRSVPRSLWRADRSVADNLIDLAIDGRLMTRLTGRSPIG